jgi:TPR repeat protein
MVESTRQVHPRDPYDSFDEALSDSRLYQTHQPGRAVGLPYQPPEQEQDDALAYEPVPLFLSNYQEDDEELKHRFGSGGERNISRALLWSRILKGGIVSAFAAGIALAILSMDNPLSVFANAKASLAGDTSGQLSSGQLSATEPALPPQSVAVRPTNSEPAPDNAAPRRIQPAGLTSVSPSRDEITAAYQGAIKSKVVAIEPATQAVAPVEAAPPPAARRIAPDELAALLKRAKGLLAVGDITSARLLLERAADAQEAEAALMLAGTYDPQVLGTRDMRSITPDPAAARLWYQKAAQLGSVDARRRLQTQN